MDHILTLEITPDGAGGVAIKPRGTYVRPGQASFPAGAVLTLTPVATLSGASFERWEGAIMGSAGSASLTMDSDKTVRAFFAVPTTTVTSELRTSVTGSGTVAPSTGRFDPGERITLVANADPGNEFVSWSGDTDGCTSVPGMPNTLLVLMDRARRISATFQPKAASAPLGPRPSGIPHPEEAMNPMATLANTDVNAIMNQWLRDWAVPPQHWDHWRTAIDTQVYEVYPDSLGMRQDTPAGTWEADGKRHLAIKPQWLNPGVIAHEQAHNSYAMLNDSQRAAFATVYSPLKNNDPLIRLLYSKNAYGLTSDIEGHAEVYRYIGQWMPEQLKQYYPMLFEIAPEVREQKAGEPRRAAGQAETAQEAAGQRAKVIPEPPAGTRSVIDSKVLPVAVSSGDVNYLCGSCGVLLIQGLIGGQFNDLVIKCPKCGAFNEM